MRKIELHRGIQIISLLIGLWGCFNTATSVAAPGSLDVSFDGDGKVITNLGGTIQSARAVAVQPDGKILLGGSSNGDFALMRYNSNGSLDATFGSAGVAITSIGDGDSAYAVALQADGKILLAGSTTVAGQTDFALARYNSNGSLDASFGSGGVITSNYDPGEVAYAIALQTDGKVLLGGTAGGEIALLRFTSNGVLDSGFAGGGRTVIPIGGGLDAAYAVTVQADGRILLGGYSTVGAYTDFALVRCNENGSVDSSFGAGGRVITPIGSSHDIAYAIAVHPDGRILLAGSAVNGSYTDFAIARYTSNGVLDTSLAGIGKVTTSLALNDVAYAMEVQPDGKILLAGNGSNGTSTDFALARYSNNGVLDGGFGASGKLLIPVGTANDVATAVALQPDGKIVVGGYVTNSSVNGFALTRYLANDSNNDGVAEAWDLTPDLFSFADVSNVPVLSIQTTTNISIAGLGEGIAVPVTVSGGEYAINNGSYTNNTGYAQNGNVISVRHTAAATLGGSTNTLLSVGGLHAANNLGLRLGTAMADTFTSTTTVPDTTPNQFYFTDQIDVPLSTSITSNSVIVTGVAYPAEIQLYGSGEYSINNGSFTRAIGTVMNGDMVTLRHTSSSSAHGVAVTVVVIGGVYDIFSTITVDDLVPDVFSFTDVVDVALFTQMTSNIINVSGITAATPVYITGGTYSINGGPYTSAAGMVMNGNSITVRHASAATPSTTVTTLLMVGDVPEIFSSTTAASSGVKGAKDGDSADSNGGGGSLNGLWLLLLSLPLLWSRYLRSI